MKKETSYFVQALLGFATSMIFLLWTLGILFATHGGWFSLVPFLIFIGLCFYIKRHWHWRGFTVGTLIGLGLTILVVGLCASVVTKSLRKMQQRHGTTTTAPIKNGNK